MLNKRVLNTTRVLFCADSGSEAVLHDSTSKPNGHITDLRKRKHVNPLHLTMTNCVRRAISLFQQTSEMFSLLGQTEQDRGDGGVEVKFHCESSQKVLSQHIHKRKLCAHGECQPRKHKR